MDGRKEYFRDVFKYLDLLAYSCELYVGYLYFLANANIDSVLPVSAWAVLLMCFKTLSFARGFSAWGTSLLNAPEQDHDIELSFCAVCRVPQVLSCE